MSNLLLLIVGATLLPLLVWLTMFLLHEPGKRIWVGIIWTVGLGSALVEIVSPRTISDDGLASGTASISQAQVWLSRALVFFFMYLVLLATLVWVRNGRPLRRLNLSGTALLFTIGPVLAALFGTVPKMELGLFYFPMLVLAVGVMPPISVTYFSTQVKRILGIYLYASVIAAVVSPGWATSSYSGFLPGIDFRFNGLASQANLMGPLALLYLILDWERPRAKGTISAITRLVAWSIVLLAQSKVTWVIAVVAYVARPWIKSGSSRQLAMLVRGVKTVAVTLLGWVAYLMRSELLELDQAYGIATLTGRTQIWVDTLHIWMQQPWFGYGPTLWSVDFRLAFGGTAYLWVGQAHNQFVQALGETGIIGFALLVPYLFNMTRVGLRFTRQSHGVSLGLSLFVLLRCMTETPLRAYAVNETLFINLVVLGYLLLSERQAESQVPELPLTRELYRTVPDGGLDRSME